MRRTIKWGIIGAGGIVKRRTLPAMSDVANAEIIAIMDKRYDDLVELSREYNIPYIYQDEDELLKNPDIDAVYIASPVCFHKDQVKKVLAAGKHLLVEKPLGLNLTESKEIVEFSQKFNAKAGAAMVMHFHDGHQKIKDIVQKGELGQIVNCRAQLTCWFPDMKDNWRQIRMKSGGGSLMDMGIHCIDLLSYILDDEIEQVGGFIDTKTFHYEVEDSASIIMKTKKGTVCYIDNYFNIPDDAAKCFLEIYGTKGSIIANGTIGQDGGGVININTCGQSSGYNSAQCRNEISSEKLLEFEKCNMYARQIESFSNCILNNTQPETTLENACKDMQVIENAYTAAKEGKIRKI